MQVQVSDNPDRSRFEVYVDDELAGYASYQVHGDRMSIPHTLTSPEFRHRGLASTLIRETLDAARARQLEVLPLCPFVSWFIDRNREYLDLVPEDQRERFGLQFSRG